MFRLISKQILFSLVLLCGLDFVFAQSAVPALGAIQAQFCSNGNITKDLDLITRAGQKLPFCIEFTNSSSTGVALNIDFLDSVITDDAFKRRSCNAADRPRTAFGNYILPYEKSLFLSGKASVQKWYTIAFPIGFNGISHGCIAYNIPASKEIMQSENTQFTVVVRNIKFLDIYVGETTVDTALGLSSYPILLADTASHYALNFTLENKGNVSQRLSISGSLDNFLGYNKQFFWSGVLIPAKEKMNFSTKDFGGYYLPFYKGFFRIRLEVEHTPQFAFDIDSPTKISKVTSPGVSSFTRIVVIYNWQFFVAIFFVLFILMLIYLAIFRKRKVIVVLK